VGGQKLMADIDDPGSEKWRATLTVSHELSPGSVKVVLLGANGDHKGSSTAKVVPGGAGGPTVLEGFEAFH